VATVKLKSTNLWISYHLTQDPLGYKSFPLQTGFCYVQVPFKTGFTVLKEAVIEVNLMSVATLLVKRKYFTA
jgi:hypothetical protein